MLPPTGGEDGRHGLAGSKTAVALGTEDREMSGRLARMRTAQAQAAHQGPDPAAARLRRDAGPRRREGRARGRRRAPVRGEVPRGRRRARPVGRRPQRQAARDRRRRPRVRGRPRVPEARRPGPLRRALDERPALGPRQEGGGGRRPPEARDAAQDAQRWGVAQDARRRDVSEPLTSSARSEWFSRSWQHELIESNLQNPRSKSC